MRFLSALLFTAIASAAPRAHATFAIESFVVPSAYAAAESPDGGNSLPFSTTGGNTRCQVIFLDADVPPGPFSIHGIALRPDAAGMPTSKSLSSVELRLSTPSIGTTVLSPTFADNVGPNPTLVRSGPLTLETAATGPSAGPKDFDVLIWFDTPFPYTSGDLLLDVRILSTEAGNVFFDSAGAPGDAVGRVCSVGLFGGSAAAATGDADSGGQVTEFLLAPEPAAGGTPLVALAALRLRRRASRALAQFSASISARRASR